MPILDQLEDAPSKDSSILHKLDDATPQQNAQQPGMIDRFTSGVKQFWDAANKPIVDLSPQTKQVLSSYQQNHPIIGGVGNFGVNTLTSLTSPLSLGLAAATSGGSLAEKAGMGGLASVLETPGKVAAGGMVGHGLYNVYNQPTLAGKAGGGIEAGLGALGLRHFTMSPAAEDIAATTEAIKPITPAPLTSNPVMPEGGFKTVNRPTQDIIADTVRQSFPPEGTSQKIDQILQDNSSPIDKLNAAIKGVRPVRETQNELNAIEHAKRMNAFNQVKVTDEASMRKAMGTLSGEYPKASVEPLLLEQPDVDALAKHIAESPNLTPNFERPRAFTALGKILRGEVPQENELQTLGRVFGPDFVANARNNMATIDKGRGLISNAVNLPKSLMASYDVSAPLRQGLGLIHRREYWTSFDDMFKSFASEDAFKGVQESIRAKPTFELSQKADLDLTDLTSLNNREEQFMSEWGERIPIIGRGVRASNRAYVGFLNKLRSDTFETLINSAKDAGLDPDKNLSLAKEIAGYVNTATGRGSLGSMERYAVGLNNVFFSPKFIASRVQMLNPATYINASPFVRKEYLKSLLAIATAGTTAVELGKVLGGEVVNDPTNSDFRKLKIGNTRLDPYGGFQPYITAAARLILGETTSSTTGKTTELGQKFGAPARFDILKNFTANKMAPVPKFAYDLLSATKHRPVDMTSLNPFDNRISQLFIPMVIQDTNDLIKDNPDLTPTSAAKIGLGTGLSAFGAGVQTYK